jgi:antitoxin HicB
MSKELSKRKELDYYLNLIYPFTVRPDLDDGGYIVEFPDLRYCVGTGDTIEEAINDAMFAKSEWIKASYGAGITVPEPTSREEFNGRVTLRIPKSLHRLVVETAKREGVSANQFLSHLISIGIGKKTI